MTNARAILCVDDEERDLDLQQATFESAGYKVRLARNLNQVQDVLHKHPIDAVVLDYRLINTDPIHVAISVRKHSPRMPIVLLSGYLEDIPEFFKRAVDGCMKKDDPREKWIEMLDAQFIPGHNTTASCD